MLRGGVGPSERENTNISATMPPYLLLGIVLALVTQLVNGVAVAVPDGKRNKTCSPCQVTTTTTVPRTTTAYVYSRLERMEHANSHRTRTAIVTHSVHTSGSTTATVSTVRTFVHP